MILDKVENYNLIQRKRAVAKKQRLLKQKLAAKAKSYLSTQKESEKGSKVSPY